MPARKNLIRSEYQSRSFTVWGPDAVIAAPEVFLECHLSPRLTLLNFRSERVIDRAGLGPPLQIP